MKWQRLPHKMQFNSFMENKKSKVLIIYTGGTIGMVADPETGWLKPFEFDHLDKHIPELKSFDIELDVHSFEEPIDSSDMHPSIWTILANIIYDNYNKYDGFVILHGSDTMAYTASALSFMLQNLNKPVILTGSQLPVGVIRTDGKENLITSIEIAGAKDEAGNALVQEVALYFEYQLMRGNRTTKISASHFDAFSSPNFPELAEAGVEIEYNIDDLLRPKKPFIFHDTLDNRVSVVKLFPGMRPELLECLTYNKNIKGIILETYGSGNATTADWFLAMIQNWINEGKIVINITQCIKGDVVLGKYLNSKIFKDIGIISGRDLTTEAAVTKMMYALSVGKSDDEVKRIMENNIAGELG